MAEEDKNMEDLEDGEIESDGEQPETSKAAAAAEPAEVEPVEDKKHDKEKKKKDKHKRSDDRKSSFERSKENSVDDDFAGNIEKAIRKELKKRDNASAENGDSGVEDADSKKKHKKRKKHEHHDKDLNPKKKRKEESVEEDVDDDEMMCVRGASPVRRRRPSREHSRSPDDYDSNNSDCSDREFRDRRMRSYRGRGGMKDFRGDRMRSRYDRPKQDVDGVCFFYLQGKCYKGDDCVYSHEGRPMRKMELCKFYLTDCCAKRDKCLYLHSDFPCKYYHTGLACDSNDNCKFAHGKPLSENFKMILLKHIESAPKEILGNFPRPTREQAMVMINAAQNRLRQQYNMKIDDKADDKLKSEDCDDKPKKARTRQSRWCDSPPVNPFQSNSSLTSVDTQNILSIRNLTGVLSKQQIADLTSMGIDNLNQLSQLTVIQLNHLGITINQINEIQLNTMNIQKLGLINSEPANSSSFFNKKPQKDLDMRIPIDDSKVEDAGKDVDMRLVPNVIDNRKNEQDEPKKSLDIDQYTKDALKFIGSDDAKPEIEEKKSLDVDHRVLNYVRDATIAQVKLDDDHLADTDIRLTSLPVQQQQMYMRIQQKNEQRERRPTTDDEEDFLHIDEKWYSSDEEQDKPAKPATPPAEDPAPQPLPIEPNTVLKNLGDLSKIDISAEVTKLLTSIKSNSEPTKPVDKPRDPRSQPKTEKKPTSIYDCVETTEVKLDTDLRQQDVDLRLTNFGDTDLRQTPGGSSDVDLRLALPLKPIPNHTPAKEIDGSITSHNGIQYDLKLVDIPKPNYLDIKNSIPKSTALNDPRLRILFRLSTEEPAPEKEKPKPEPVVRVDPRKRSTDTERSAPKSTSSTSLDLQVLLQTSEWYKELSSNNKISVNQQLASVTANLKKFRQDPNPSKKFDLSDIKSNNFLCMIFGNLGVFLDENGEFFNINQDNNRPQYGGNMNYNQNMDGGMYMGDNMMGGRMGPMMNPPMNFDPRFQPMADPRGAPGILGMAPNMPPNFDNYNGPNYNDNFNNYDDYGDGYMGDKMNDDYYGMQNDYKESYRGRGNERWNNRNRNRGGRDRRGFTERSGWKNDRH